MVNSKKMSKSTVAIVLLSLLLVLSLILTATGAWFTDTKTAGDKTLTFGTVELDTVSLSGVAVSNTIETTNTNLMPGSTISGKVSVKNKGNSAAWLRYKVSFEGEGAEYITMGSEDEYQYVAAALDGEGEASISISATVDNTVGNAAQGKSVTIKIVVEALQQANTQSANSETIWEGVTIVAVQA